MINGLGVAYDAVATAVPFLPGGFGILKSAGRTADALQSGAEGGRAANKLKPIEGAEAAHSTFKKDAGGNITNTAEYKPNPKNPTGFDEVKRVDVAGKAHTNSDGARIDTPHVHEAGKKDVRPALPDELPRRRD